MSTIHNKQLCIERSRHCCSILQHHNFSHILQSNDLQPKLKRHIPIQQHSARYTPKLSVVCVRVCVCVCVCVTYVRGVCECPVSVYVAALIYLPVMTINTASPLATLVTHSTLLHASQHTIYLLLSPIYESSCKIHTSEKMITSKPVHILWWWMGLFPVLHNVPCLCYAQIQYVFYCVVKFFFFFSVQYAWNNSWNTHITQNVRRFYMHEYLTPFISASHHNYSK